MAKPKARKNKAKDIEVKKPKALESLNLTELKALAYDVIAYIEDKQKFLARINNLIVTKGNQHGKGTVT